MPHDVDDFAVQGTPDTLLITGDGFACILSCLLIVYSGGFTFEGPRDEIQWAQLGHSTRDADNLGTAQEMPGTLAFADDGFSCGMCSFLFADILLSSSIFIISRYSDIQDQSLLSS